jgi:hypothetical protein
MKWIESDEEDIDQDDIYRYNFDGIKYSFHGEMF